ncbi:hypothetical protein AOZ06_44690 [Kibdelosporangium phytohabitans]|uniref:Galactose oxidase n=1 Tax=Kibdelosporangium phytohabitans TaxID=860235 RepID=A0A0N9IE19_9PSEU|nr:hypothetical protein AOZ06_44690 [Kibdelosporangium phytohabitans]
MVIAFALILSACSTPAPAPTAQGKAPVPQAASAIAAGWERAAAAPVKLGEVGAAVFKGKIWTAGGFTADQQPTTKVLVFDPVNNYWRSGPDAPEAVHHPAMVAAGDKLYLIGGYVVPHDATAHVWVLDPSGQSWVAGPPLPEKRAAGAAAWDGKRVVFGGGTFVEGQPRGDVFALENDTWRRLGAFSKAREHLGAATDGNGTVWFLAGRNTSGPQADNDIVKGDTVSPTTPMPIARGGVAGFYAGEARGGCSAGGEDVQGTYGEVQCVNANGEVSNLPNLGIPRHGIGAVVVDNTAYVLLGGSKPNLVAMTDVVEKLPLS